MDWETLQNAIKAWLETITALPVVWENEPRPALMRQNAFVVVSPPTDITTLGQDYVQETESDADPLLITPVVVGWRLFTVTVRVISRSHTPSRTGRHYAERAKLSLKMPSILETLRAASIAVVTAGPTIQFDAPFDDRVESIAAFELTLSTTATFADIGGDIGTIGSVELTSHIDPAGTPPNLDEEVISMP